MYILYRTYFYIGFIVVQFYNKYKACSSVNRDGGSSGSARVYSVMWSCPTFQLLLCSGYRASQCLCLFCVVFEYESDKYIIYNTLYVYDYLLYLHSNRRSIQIAWSHLHLFIWQMLLLKWLTSEAECKQRLQLSRRGGKGSGVSCRDASGTGCLTSTY